MGRVAAWLRRIAVVALLASASFASASPGHRVKAAFVYKFGEYVEWPAEAFARADSPLVIGVSGADALADELERLTSGRSVGGRAIVVRKLAPGASWEGLHVAFLGGDDAKQLAGAIAAGAGRPVLTITEATEARAAGMINFVVVEGKVRFDVALPAAEASRLKISSRLLGVARKVVVP